MIIKFLKNLWKDIQFSEREGTLFGAMVGMGLIHFLIGAVLIDYSKERVSYFLVIGNFLLGFGIILISIPILILLIGLGNLFFGWIKEIWIQTKEEKNERR